MNEEQFHAKFQSMVELVRKTAEIGQNGQNEKTKTSVEAGGTESTTVKGEKSQEIWRRWKESVERQGLDPNDPKVGPKPRFQAPPPLVNGSNQQLETLSPPIQKRKGSRRKKRGGFWKQARQELGQLRTEMLATGGKIRESRREEIGAKLEERADHRKAIKKAKKLAKWKARHNIT